MPHAGGVALLGKARGVGGASSPLWRDDIAHSVSGSLWPLMGLGPGGASGCVVWRIWGGGHLTDAGRVSVTRRGVCLAGCMGKGSGASPY